MSVIYTCEWSYLGRHHGTLQQQVRSWALCMGCQTGTQSGCHHTWFPYLITKSFPADNHKFVYLRDDTRSQWRIPKWWKGGGSKAVLTFSKKHPYLGQVLSLISILWTHLLAISEWALKGQVPSWRTQTLCIQIMLKVKPQDKISKYLGPGEVAYKWESKRSMRQFWFPPQELPEQIISLLYCLYCLPIWEGVISRSSLSPERRKNS